MKNLTAAMLALTLSITVVPRLAEAQPANDPPYASSAQTVNESNAPTPTPVSTTTTKRNPIFTTIVLSTIATPRRIASQRSYHVVDDAWRVVAEDSAIRRQLAFPSP